MLDKVVDDWATRRRRRQLERLRRALLPGLTVLACHLAMIAGFVVVGSHVSRVSHVEGGLHRFFILCGLLTIAGFALFMIALVRLVDDDDLGPLQTLAAMWIVGFGWGFGMAVSREGDQELLRTGPSATAVGHRGFADQHAAATVR